MLMNAAVMLDGWSVRASREGEHLLIERQGMPGHIHITADSAALLIGLCREKHTSLACFVEARYSDLRAKLRVVLPAEQAPAYAMPEGMELVRMDATAEVGDWRAWPTQVRADGYVRHCLEIRHIGRPGMIHAGTDADSLSVEVWDHSVDRVVASACVSHEEMRRRVVREP